MSWLMLLLAGCGSGPAVCAFPAEDPSPAWADANADGRVDVNDGVRIVRSSLSGGAPVACRGQGDLLASGDVAFEAAGNIWNYLFVGAATAMPPWEGCETRHETGPPPACVPVALSIEAPARVNGDFEAMVHLKTDLGPDAWSFGVAAEECTITAATRAGTVSDSTFSSPPGIVDEGLAQAAVVPGGAVSAIVPSWRAPTSLDASGDGANVLALSVSAPPPASGCAPCTLRFTPDLRGDGQPVAVVVGLAGWSFAPSTTDATVNVCAP